MTIADKFEKIPLDARLLSYAIIELNISRRKVAIYPRDHPSVERSLNNAFKFLNQLFEIRSEIKLTFARDKIIIDKYQLDEKNPVFRDFALNLNQMNIAHITLKTGITKDELYRFHSFITEKLDDLTVDNLRKIFKRYKITHIEVGFVDFRNFSIGDKSVQQASKLPLWERYVYSLIEDKFQHKEICDEISDIPPEILARLLNNISDRNIKEEAYEKIITTYMRSFSENSFSGQDLKKLLEFIEHLMPDLKKRFLSSAVKVFSKDNGSAHQAFKKISIEEIDVFIDTVNKQGISIPQTLTNLIDKFSYGTQDSSDIIYLEEDLLEDEEFFPSNLAEIYNENDSDKVLNGNDLREIQSLINFDASRLKTSQLIEFENEFHDDLIEKRFNQIILELISSDTVSEETYRSFVNIIKEQSEQLLWIGQYVQVLDILKVFELNKASYKYPDINSEALQYYHSPEFIVKLIDSFKLLGRQMRKEVWSVCEYYDEKIIPCLVDALVEEESQTVRRFLMELLKKFGNKVIDEAIKRLRDERWFVKRNMLYILRETDIKEVTEYIRPCCRHENYKVSIAALKCLLDVKDNYAVEIIREYLTSDSENLFQQAVALSGSFKIKEVVDDLIRLLKKQRVSGDDILDKISIVRALGDIGDPRAIDALRILVSRKSIFFKKITDQLKEEIYRTLKNYPYELVEDLVEAGIESKNEVIRDESLRLRKENIE